MNAILQELNIRGIRGIPESGIDLKFDQGHTVIVGSNASGKSSIADGIEVLLSPDGGVSYFGKKETERQPGPKKAAHVDGGVAEVHAIWRTATGSIPISRALNAEMPTELTGLLDRARFPRFVIRGMRAREEVVDASANRRGTWINESLGLDRVPEITKSLQGIARAWNAQIEIIDGELQRDHEALQNAYDGELEERALVEWMKDSVRAAGVEGVELEGLDAWPTVLSTLLGGGRMQELEDELDVAETSWEALEGFLGSLCDSQMAQSATEFDAARETYRRAVTDVAREIVGVLSLWREAETYLRGQPDVGECPVCEQSIRPRWSSAEALADRLLERQETVREVIEARENLTAAIENIAESAQRVATAVGEHQQTFASLADKRRALRIMQRLMPAAHALQALTAQDFDSILQTELPGADFVREELGQLQIIILFAKAGLRHDIERLKSALSLQQQALPDACRRIDEAFKSWYACEATRKRKEQADHIRKDLDLFFAAFHKSISGYRTNILNLIGDDVKKFCQAVVKNSGAEDRVREFESVEFLPTGQDERDVLVRIGFYGRTKDMPQALLSDSRLNLLAIAVSLALIRNFNTDFPFVVLDDLLTSLDPDHRVGIAKVIPEWLNDFQVIVLTNDEKFAEYLRPRGFDVRRIRNWTCELGPRIEDEPSREELIDAALQAENAREAGINVRIEIDNWLRDRCEGWYAKVPLGVAGNWNIGHLRPAFQRRVNKTRKAITRLQGAWKEAEGKEKQSQFEYHVTAANWMSHHTPPDATNWDIADVNAVWEAFVEYRKLFCCPNCGGWFEKSAQRDDCLPTCETCQMPWLAQWQEDYIIIEGTLD